MCEVNERDQNANKSVAALLTLKFQNALGIISLKIPFAQEADVKE
jgi:hypothetical protein